MVTRISNPANGCSNRHSAHDFDYNPQMLDSARIVTPVTQQAMPETPTCTAGDQSITKSNKEQLFWEPPYR